ncbi:unnamed protein product, partial [Heterotrigona itama]
YGLTVQRTTILILQGRRVTWSCMEGPPLNAYPKICSPNTKLVVCLNFRLTSIRQLISIN